MGACCLLWVPHCRPTQMNIPLGLHTPPRGGGTCPREGPLLWFALTVAGVACWGWQQPRCVMVLEEARQPMLPPARTWWIYGVPHHLSHPQAGGCSLLHHNLESSHPLQELFLPCGVWRQQSCGWRGCPASPSTGTPSLLQGLIIYLIPGSGASGLCREFFPSHSCLGCKFTSTVSERNKKTSLKSRRKVM